MYSNNDKSKNQYPKCGEIWMCNLHSFGKSVQVGYRPVFILSNDKNNTYSPTLNVIPLTTKMNKRRLPIHVELWEPEKYGLREPSTLLIEQIMTISNDSLSHKIGDITDPCVLKQISSAIQIQFPVMSLIA